MASSPPFYSPQDTSPPSSSLVARQPKRRGVALSCAECRRLKLKCSRVFPCSNCVKKGVAAICPEGSLTTGKGNRFVLANTEALHEKISVLATRVRQLEDGLAQSHALTSHESHPLLSEELLQIKRPLERERQDNGSQDEKPETEDTIDSLGSLSISTSGKAAFFGVTANSWYLLQNEECSDEEEESPFALDSSPGPSDIPWLSHAFPFAAPIGVTAESVRQTVLSKLPNIQVARALTETYYRHAAWMYTPITEEDFDVIFRQVYNPDGPSEQLTAQNLGVLCSVLALGARLDLSKPANSPEAMVYHHLARAALSIESVLEDHSISAIQALVLMCHFMFLSDMNGPRWVTMGIAVKLAQSVGLHRDTGKWRVDPEQTQKRRELFYELLTYDSWQSLTYGRPPSFSTAHIDNQMPHEVTRNENGEIEMSFASWKHRYSAQCLSIIHDQAYGARTPNYKHLQDLDKKVRTWYVPPSLQVPGFGSGSSKALSGEVEQPTVQLTMQRYIVFAIREMTLFYMHRGFFAQALEDNPADPMGSKYSPSVLAAYNSATSFVGLIESLFNQHPVLTERMWFLFTHVFSCAIVLGSIAAKSKMVLARSALSHLDSAYNLFSRVTDTAKSAKILPILAKLKDRAHLTAASSHLPALYDSSSRLSTLGPKVKSEVDELSALGGMTRLVSRRSSSSPSVSSPSSPSQQSSQQSSLSSPPPGLLTETQLYQIPPTSEVSSPTTSWQNYTHIQNLNVNINMGLGEFYSSAMPLTPGGTAVAQQDADMAMLYTMPPTHHHSQTPSPHPLVHPHQQQHQEQQQQQQQLHQQQLQQHQHPQHVPHRQHSSPTQGYAGSLDMGLGMPTSSPQEAYYMAAAAYGGGGGGYVQMFGGRGPMVASPGDTPSPNPPHDLHDTWQNFMTQTMQ